MSETWISGESTRLDVCGEIRDVKSRRRVAEQSCRGKEMQGKTCLITGGTSGIGKALAGSLSRLGADVVILGRDKARCVRAVGELRKNSKHAKAEWVRADLSNMGDVRRVAEEILERWPRLEVLVHNAGGFFEYRRESVDGVEMTLATNHLGPFLLTSLLMSRMRASAPSRILIVGSSAHKDVQAFDFDDPQARSAGRGRGTYPASAWASARYALLNPWAHPAFLQYSQSKLANMLFMRALARRMEKSGVTVNAVDPGLVATGFASGSGPYSWCMRRQAAFFGRRPEDAAEHLVDLVVAERLSEVSGRYFQRGQEISPSTAALDDVAAERLWDFSEELAGLRNERPLAQGARTTE